MKLFLALALVANLSTAVAANDAALPGLRRNGITADADADLLIEAVAAADDADDVDASHHQDALDNQADSSKSAVPKFLRGIQVGMVATTTNINCAAEQNYTAACKNKLPGNNYFFGWCNNDGKLVCYCNHC
mmetsp:Transcript_1213/g.1858  ORF Transcript_1213/g.1858 Transcript_1213/m.1858 type:complete len:132 (+) Transcript_1213:64-459(+)